MLQLKTGSGSPCDVLEVRLWQTSITSSQLLEVQFSVWSGAYTAGTVSAGSVVSFNIGDPSSNIVTGTSSTGYNASAEPSGGTQSLVYDSAWNTLNGEYVYLPPPEGRIRVPVSDLFTIKLNTAPSSGTYGALLTVIEYI